MSNPDNKKKKVIVVGAGIAGLAFSVHILKHGSEFYDVHMFEKIRNADDTNSGFAVALSPNALRILKELEIDLIKEGIAMPLNQVMLHHAGFPDKVLVHVKKIFPDPHTVLWVERGPLVDILLDQFHDLGGQIDYDSRVEHINYHPDGAVAVTFSNNKTCVGDYIVGADGVHSNIRKCLYTNSFPKKIPTHSPLWGSKVFSMFSPLLRVFGMAMHDTETEFLLPIWRAAPTPWTALYGITTRLPNHLLTGGEEDPDGVGTMHWYLRDCPGAYSTNSLRNGRVFWVCYQNEPISTTRYYTEDQAIETMNRYSGAPYCAAVPDAFGMLPDEVGLNGVSKKARFREIFSRSEKVMKVRLHHTFFHEISDDQKKVVLIGDAAHPMNTFHGQGAGMAIEEGLVLCNGLLRVAWASRYPQFEVDKEELGIRYYENVRMSRNEKVSSLGWWFGIGVMGDWWIVRKIRDVALVWGLRGPTPDEIVDEHMKAIMEGREPLEKKNWLFDHVIKAESEIDFWMSIVAEGF